MVGFAARLNFFFGFLDYLLINGTVAYHLPTTQEEGIRLSAFPKGTTSELAGFVFTQSFMLSAKQGAVNTNFLKSLVRLDPESNFMSTASQPDALSHSADKRIFNQKNKSKWSIKYLLL